MTRWAVVAAALAAGCRQEMADQPRYNPLEPSRYFADGRSARDPVAGTLAREVAWGDPHLLTGRRPDAPPADKTTLDRAADYEESFPFPVTPDVMRRGRERFHIYCVACHGPLGTGGGPVVAAGFPAAESYHSDRFRQAPAGYLFDVITRGHGAMPAFAGQIEPRDRWAIVAYVRALQLSRHAELKDLPPDIRGRFEGSP